MSLTGMGTSGPPSSRVVRGRLQVEFLRRTSDADLSAAAQFSGTLPDGFSLSSESETVTTIDSEFERVVVKDSETTASSVSQFAKVVLEHMAP